MSSGGDCGWVCVCAAGDWVHVWTSRGSVQECVHSLRGRRLRGEGERREQQVITLPPLTPTQRLLNQDFLPNLCREGKKENCRHSSLLLLRKKRKKKKLTKNIPTMSNMCLQTRSEYFSLCSVFVLEPKLEEGLFRSLWLKSSKLASEVMSCIKWVHLCLI